MNFNEPVPASLLRHRPFVLYWNARIFSAIAFQIVNVAVGWQMYALTNSAFDLGLIGLMQFLPATALILIAGQLADRYDRRVILQLCQTVEGLAAAALAWGSFTGSINKQFILIAVFFLGAGRAFEATTNAALLPAVVPGSLLPRAIAASSSAQQAATIGGPALGGFLYIMSPTIVYCVCGVLFLCAVAQLSFLHATRTPSTRVPVTPKVFFAGVSYILHNKILLAVILLDLFAVLLGGATALLPIFAKDVFDVGPPGLGMLRAAPAVGAILVMLVLSHTTITRRVGKIEFVTVAFFGAATVAFGLSHSFTLALVALAVMGATDAVSVVIRMTLMQLETPDDMRGRVSAVNSLFVSMSNQVGEFRAGMVAALVGAVPAVVIGGVGTLIVVAIIRQVFPSLYAIENFHDIRPPESAVLTVPAPSSPSRAASG